MSVTTSPSRRASRSALALRRGGNRGLAVGAAMLLGAFLLRGNSALPAETVLAPLGWLAVAAGAGMRCLLELRLGGRPARRTPLVEPVLQGAEPADAGRLGAARVPVPIDPPPAAPVGGGSPGRRPRARRHSAAPTARCCWTARTCCGAFSPVHARRSCVCWPWPRRATTSVRPAYVAAAR